RGPPRAWGPVAGNGATRQARTAPDARAGTRADHPGGNAGPEWADVAGDLGGGGRRALFRPQRPAAGHLGGPAVVRPRPAGQPAAAALAGPGHLRPARSADRPRG